MLNALRAITVLLAALFLVSGSALAESDPEKAHAGAVAEAHAEAGDHHGEHGEGKTGLPQFDPSSFPTQVFWLLVVFSAMYMFFSKKTLPEISDVIENRNAQIQDDLDTAERLKEEAEDAQKSYEELLSKARQESADVFSQMEEETRKSATTKHDALNARTAKSLKEAEDTIEKAKLAAMGDMNIIAAEIASQASEKILGVKTDIKQANAIVQSLQNKLSKAA